METQNLIFLLGVGAFCTPLLFAETYSYEIEGVESLDIHSGVEFTVQCGDVNKLEIYADSEDDVKMSFNNKKLKIGRKSRNAWLFFPLWRRSNDVTANLMLKNPPQYIELGSGSEGKMGNCFKKQASLNLSTSSGSSIEIDGGSGSITELEVRMSSGSEIELKGTLHINHLTLRASSGSDFEADDKVVIEASEVRVSSGATIEICGALAVSGKASSGGYIGVAENSIITDFTTRSGGGRHKC